ncbi:Acetohydroxy acid isomeroreductase, NADPH-binding domain [seawater metagenome]|uniref:Alpha-keto-beta-hydroxylacyl reductoisomerase n=1 Tax=seawater metagenome TaxID=1561972 RepID=A0A5E8CIK2_9ZZZZ
MFRNTRQIKRTFSTIMGENILNKKDVGADFVEKTLKNKVVATLGYGPQAMSQSLNLRDNGINVILGVRKSDSKSSSWSKALADGWEADKNLFTIDEAAHKGDIVQYLLSDAGQISQWPSVESNLKPGNALYFSHGFGIVYSDQTNIKPAEDIDVIMVAPKGPGIFVRRNFLEGKHVNASWSVHNNYSGNATNLCHAMGFGIGCNNLFETTFKKEVYSDLVGERSVLMGMMQGAFLAQYDVLRERGHSPSEAYNETVEEGLKTLYPLIAENGMDWMYSNCSTTAQRGALDWAPKYYSAIKPVIEECYQQVENGEEARISIEANSADDYREKLEVELAKIKNQEIWKTFHEMKKLR